MKTTFLQLGILLAMSIIVVGFTSCNGDEPIPTDSSVIRATNVVGNTNEIAFVRNLHGGRPPWQTIAEAPFQNNGFTMQLPETLPNHFLTHISDGLVPFGGNFLDFTITGNIETRWLRPFDFAPGFTAFDKDGVSIGSIFFGRDIENYDDNTIASWVYVTDDIIIAGETDVVCYGLSNSLCIQNFANLNLNKGWNLIYVHRLSVTNGDNIKITHTFTSQRPSGKFSWRFIPTRFN